MDRGIGPKCLRAGSVFILTIGLEIIVGCSGCERRTSVTATPKPPLSAQQIWEKMLSAYRDAAAYSDQGTVTLTYQDGSESQQSRAQVAIQFKRPNRFLFRAYQAEGASDGEHFRARVLDENTENVDGQVIVRPIGDKPGLPDLLGDPLLSEQMNNAIVTGPWGRHPFQLDLLLEGNPFPPVGTDGGDRTIDFALQTPTIVEGHACYQIAARTIHGTFRVFVDQNEFLVRRIEYPLESLDSNMVNSPGIKKVRLVADMTAAEFRLKDADDSFQIELPDNAKPVRFLVPPPQPLPTELFGKQSPAFSLVDPGGGPVTRDSLAGTITVMIWFSNHPACQSTLRQFDNVRKRFAGQDRFQFLAICTEPAAVTNQDLVNLLKDWKVQTRMLRDLQAQGLDVFKIVGSPTVLILDGDSRVQMFQMGANPELEKDLPDLLNRLAEGVDISKEVLAQSLREREEYHRRLALASSSGGVTPTVIDIPTVSIRDRTSPRLLELTEYWTSSACRLPGNLTAADDSEPSHLFVLDEGQRLLEIGAAGERVGEFSLPQNEGRPLTFVRTARTARGRYFVVGSLFGQRVYLLDAEGTEISSYPPAEEEHAGIRDAQLADLNGDGELEWYVAFWGNLGFHCVDFRGQMVWSDRTLLSVLSLATSPPNAVGWRRILAAGESGRILKVNQFGNPDRPVGVANWGIHQLYAGRFPHDRESIFCGVSYSGEGQVTLVALDEQLVEKWNYPLPAGQHKNAMEFVTSGRLVDDVGQWVAGAADGSIHIISSDGEFSDYFCTGEVLRGLAVAMAPEGNVLVVSTSDRIAAWRINKKAAK